MFLYSSYAPSASLLLATQQQAKQMRELSNMSITLQHWQTKNTEIYELQLLVRVKDNAINESKYFSLLKRMASMI